MHKATLNLIIMIYFVV